MKSISLRWGYLLGKSGVYIIKNKVDGGFYIGSSINLYKRIIQHKCNLRANIHDNRHLQNAWNKCGEENFEIDVLEFCGKEDCIALEQKYIDNMNPSYNICKVAGSRLGVPHKSFIKHRMSKLIKSKWGNEDYKNKMTKAIRKCAKTPERRKQLSEISTKFWASDGVKDVWSNRLKEQWKNPKWRDNFLQKKRKHSDEDIINIRRLYDEQGVSTRKIAKMYGKSQPSIHKIVSRQTYKDVQ